MDETQKLVADRQTQWAECLALYRAMPQAVRYQMLQTIDCMLAELDGLLGDALEVMTVEQASSDPRVCQLRNRRVIYAFANMTFLSCAAQEALAQRANRPPDAQA